MPAKLSPSNRSSFAYKTMKERVPFILRNVLGLVRRQEDQMELEFGLEGKTDLDNILHQMNDLLDGLVNDKPIGRLEANSEDLKIWNTRLEEEQKELFPEQPSWFKGHWIYVECFMYRKLVDILENSRFLKRWDPFQYQKCNSYISGLEPITTLGDHVSKLLRNLQSTSEEQRLLLARELVQISLWGNKWDLASPKMVAAGSEGRIADNNNSPLAQVIALEGNILASDLQLVMALLQKKSGRVDWVMDNAGFELFSDLCLAEFLLETGMADRAVFHVKAIPWFVSDITARDFFWTLEMLMDSHVASLGQLGRKWASRVQDGTFQVQNHQFWTSPYPFWHMQRLAPDLYQELGKSKLFLIKGDLNARKLLGDEDWAPETSFRESLQGFCPAPLVSLRTLKADLVSGLRPGLAESLTERFGSKDWMVGGDYAVIQFDSPSEP